MEKNQTQDILRQLREVQILLGRRFRDSLSSEGITVSQAMVLYSLAEEPAMRLSDLSMKLGSAPSTLSGVVDRLERGGWVQRRRAPRDRREIMIQLTPYARQRLEERTGHIQELFPESDIALISQALGRMRDALTDPASEKISSL